MKLHNTLIEKLIKVYEINSGWTEERKLKEALAKLNIAVYKQASGESVLIDQDQLETILRERDKR